MPFFVGIFSLFHLQLQCLHIGLSHSQLQFQLSHKYWVSQICILAQIYLLRSISIYSSFIYIPLSVVIVSNSTPLNKDLICQTCSSSIHSPYKNNIHSGTQARNLKPTLSCSLSSLTSNQLPNLIELKYHCLLFLFNTLYSYCHYFT